MKFNYSFIESVLNHLIKVFLGLNFRINIYLIDQYTLINLKAHQTMHTGEKRYACERCGKAFSYKTSLIQHIKLHEGDKPFQCAHCSKRFTQKGNLEEHIRTHTGEKPFACSLCDRRFTTSSQHKMHEKRHKGTYIGVDDLI